MHPILFTIPQFSISGLHLGPFPIFIYGTMLVLAFVFSIVFTACYARRINISADTILNLAIWVIVLSIVGCRVGYVLTNWGEYQGNVRDILSINKGGLSFHGGVVGGVVAVLTYCRYTRHVDDAIQYLVICMFVLAIIGSRMDYMLTNWGHYRSSVGDILIFAHAIIGSRVDYVLTKWGHYRGSVGDIFMFSHAIIGSRVDYVLTNWGHYRGSFVDIFKISKGGFLFPGGAAGGGAGVVAAVLISCWRLRHTPSIRLGDIQRRIPPLRLGDIIMPFLALGLAIGRIGCFLNGCCYGRATHNHWGVIFPNLNDGVPRHPSQLYDFTFNIAIMLLLIYPLQRFKRKDGDIVALWLILSGITRYIMEYFRYGVTAKAFWFGVTMGQWVCIAMIAGGVVMWLIKPRGRNQE